MESSSIGGGCLESLGTFQHSHHLSLRGKTYTSMRKENTYIFLSPIRNNNKNHCPLFSFFLFSFLGNEAMLDRSRIFDSMEDLHEFGEPYPVHSSHPYNRRLLYGHRSNDMVTRKRITSGSY